jgi:hypothetical protein
LSRQRSGRAAKPAAATRSKPKAVRPAVKAGAAAKPRGVYVQSPQSDIYVTMLGISLGSMLLACLFLFLVWTRYDLKTKPTAFVSQPLVQGLA